VAAIQDMTTVWNNQNKIDTFQLNLDDSVEDCCSSVRIHIYRIIQEALNNISKHSGADTVEINLQMINDKEGTQDKNKHPWIRLQIRDNGRGFDDSQEALGFGLLGIRERVAILSGEFQLKTQPDMGVSIILLIPC
jgi:two-component system sensor histidine kinase UhpB